MSAQLTDQSLDGLTDEQLMLSYRNGHAAAFDVLYARHKGGLYRYFLRQLGLQSELANELFQDVWMNLINARDRYQASAKFTTYLYHIAHNRLVDHWRSCKPESAEQDCETMIDEAKSPDDHAHHGQQSMQLRQQIQALPEEQRNAFLLKEEAALSLEQIAEVTGVNRETVKSRLRYAVKRLRLSLVSIR
ncbi:MAG: sigma-70 family RNA polymerase sigma factor [Gammaproteobacteria bacterium]|nr:sigma-70 family RNA polymerase sigma factor [Gammaproteobacteria bacterium]